MFSRLFYNAGAWNRLNSRAVRPLNRTYMSVLRAVADMKNNADTDKTSDAAVHDLLESHYIRAVIMLHRVRYFIRATKHAPPALCRLIMLGYGVSDSWVSQLQDDCDFMWHSVEAVQIDLPDPRVHFNEWVYSFRDGDKPWKANIFKACGLMPAAPLQSSRPASRQ